MAPTVGHVPLARQANTGKEVRIIQYATIARLGNICLPQLTMRPEIASAAQPGSTHHCREWHLRTRARIVLEANSPYLMVQRMWRPVSRVLLANSRHPQVLHHVKTVQQELIQPTAEGQQQALALNVVQASFRQILLRARPQHARPVRRTSHSLRLEALLWETVSMSAQGLHYAQLRGLYTMPYWLFQVRNRKRSVQTVSRGHIGREAVGKYLLSLQTWPNGLSRLMHKVRCRNI